MRPRFILPINCNITRLWFEKSFHFDFWPSKIFFSVLNVDLFPLFLFQQLVEIYKQIKKVLNIFCRFYLCRNMCNNTQSIIPEKYIYIFSIKKKCYVAPPWHLFFAMYGIMHSLNILNFKSVQMSRNKTKESVNLNFYKKWFLSSKPKNGIDERIVL